MVSPKPPNLQSSISGSPTKVSEYRSSRQSLQLDTKTRVQRFILPAGVAHLRTPMAPLTTTRIRSCKLVDVCLRTTPPTKSHTSPTINDTGTSTQTSSSSLLLATLVGTSLPNRSRLRPSARTESQLARLRTQSRISGMISLELIIWLIFRVEVQLPMGAENLM
jgi:hypothetical protein